MNEEQKPVEKLRLAWECQLKHAADWLEFGLPKKRSVQFILCNH